ncbi:hypothetical protein [Pollutimonas bauzanensis]|uniref:hypothetical protein n=1 Tax=Pollutimonas bauzanensis TaxID=658167 RepID=UPI0015B650C4|nr:hypothetical protein [Pollutimonas bauzanensis]
MIDDGAAGLKLHTRSAFGATATQDKPGVIDSNCAARTDNAGIAAFGRCAKKAQAKARIDGFSGDGRTGVIGDTAAILKLYARTAPATLSSRNLAKIDNSCTG